MKQHSNEQLIDWSILFGVLEPMNILKVITALLTEKKIILLSNNPSLFFNCCEALLSLIYPFEWIHFYKSFISPDDPCLNQYLSSPDPALFGLLSSLLKTLPSNFKGVIVKLDHNEIKVHNTTLSTLPLSIQISLFSSIMQNANFYLRYQPKHQSLIQIPKGFDKQQIPKALSNNSHKVRVDGDEIISIVDRVLLSNFSFNENTSLLYEFTRDYSQIISIPTPLFKMPHGSPSTNKYNVKIYDSIVSPSDVNQYQNHCVTQNNGNLNNNSSKNRFGKFHWLTSKKDKIELNVNINLLRNDFITAYASLLCGFDSSISNVDVQFDKHGFLASRQEIHYHKKPLKHLLLSYNNDEMETIISRLQLQFDIKFVFELFIPPNSKFNKRYVSTFHDAYDINNTTLTPRQIAQFYVTHIYGNDFTHSDDKVAAFLDECLPTNTNTVSINMKPNSNSDYTTVDNNIRSTQFLDHLLSTSLWNHFITQWKYRNSALHPTEFFTCFDVALKSYVIHISKLRELRSNILDNNKPVRDIIRKLLISGFIRNIESLLNTHTIIPLEIIHVCNSYYSNSALGNSINKVNIRCPKMSKIVQRKKKDRFKNKLQYCGFKKPWCTRFCGGNADLVQDLQTIFSKNLHMIRLNISWHYRIGAVIGHQSSKLLFETWFASFVRRLKHQSHEQAKINNQSLSSSMGIQIFIHHLQSFKTVVQVLKQSRDRGDLGGLHPDRIWISANVLNATGGSVRELIIPAEKFFSYVDEIPEFTICLSWCTKSDGTGEFTRNDIHDMKRIVDEYILTKKQRIRVKCNTYKLTRSVCFSVRTSYLFTGNVWKYIHSLLLDKYPQSCVVFTTKEEGISATNLKWLSAHFPSNRSFYAFENDDIKNDIEDLNLSSNVVEAINAPFWYGELSQKRNASYYQSEIHQAIPNDKEKAIYYDGGILCSEWRAGRVVDKAKVYLYNNRFMIANRGFVVSKHQLYPPWKINGRCILEGFAPLYVLLRSPGIVCKATSQSNVAYGVRATISPHFNKITEFSLELFGLEEGKKFKSNYESKTEGILKLKNDELCTGFVVCEQLHNTMVFSFELIDYGTLYPIEFSIQQLNIYNGRPISKKQTIKWHVTYTRNSAKYPYAWYHYVVFDSHSKAKEVIVDRLVINNIKAPTMGNAYLLAQKKTFKRIV